MSNMSAQNNSNRSAAMPRGGLPRVLSFLALGSVFFGGYEVQGRSQSSPQCCNPVPLLRKVLSSGAGRNRTRRSRSVASTVDPDEAYWGPTGGVDVSSLQLPNEIWPQVASFQRDAFALHKIFDALLPGGSQIVDMAEFLEARWQEFYENLRGRQSQQEFALATTSRTIHQLMVMGNPYVGLAAQLACYGSNGANDCRNPPNHADDVLAAVARQGLHEEGGPATPPGSFLHFLKLVDGALRRPELRHSRTDRQDEQVSRLHIHYALAAPPSGSGSPHVDVGALPPWSPIPPPAFAPGSSAAMVRIQFPTQPRVAAVGSVAVDCRYVTLSEDDLRQLGVPIDGSARAPSRVETDELLLEYTATLSNDLVVTAIVFRQQVRIPGFFYRLQLKTKPVVKEATAA